MFTPGSIVRPSQTLRRSWISLSALGLCLGGITAFAGAPGGTWTPVPNQTLRPLARTGHSLVSFNGGAFLYGGRTPVSPGPGTTTLRDIWEYKSATGKFTRLISTTPWPADRSGQACSSAGLFVFMFFGADQDGTLLNDVWDYDYYRRCWSPRTHGSGPRPNARMDHTAVTTPDNQFLIFGGRGGDGSTLLAELWRYAPSPRTWTSLAAFPDGGRIGHAAVMLGGRMYVLGGTSADGVEGDIWSYDPGQNSWMQLTSEGDVPGPFTGAAAGIGDFGHGTGAEILLVGGQDGSGTDLNTTYSITVDPVNFLAHWTRRADRTPISRAGAAAINRAAGQGSAQNLILFGGSNAGVPQDQAAIYSTYVPPPPGPDLTVSWLTQKRVSRGRGTRLRWTLSGSVKVENLGTEKTKASKLRFFLSSDTTLDGSDRQLKQVNVPVIQPTKTRTVKWTYALPAGQSGEGQYVLAVADALAQVAESNEANNSAASAPF